MTEKKIGRITFESITELNSVLKLKKDVYVLVGTLTKEFCKEYNINSEILEFDIIKGSKNKIWFAQSLPGPEQPTENQPQRMEALTNVKS